MDLGVFGRIWVHLEGFGCISMSLGVHGRNWVYVGCRRICKYSGVLVYLGVRRV